MNLVIISSKLYKKRLYRTHLYLNCRINIADNSSTFSTYVIAYSTIEGNATNRESVSTTTSGGEVSEPGISKLQSKLN